MLFAYETLFAVNASGFILQWIIDITSVCNDELYGQADPGSTVICYYANITVVPYILLTDFMDPYKIFCNEDFYL